MEQTKSIIKSLRGISFILLFFSLIMLVSQSSLFHERGGESGIFLLSVCSFLISFTLVGLLVLIQNIEHRIDDLENARLSEMSDEPSGR